MLSKSVLGLIRVGFVMSAACPIYPQHRTFLDVLGTSQLGRPDITEVSRIYAF